MAICFALQGGTILLVFVVAMTITDTNYGKESTVVAPKDLVKTVGEKNAIHAGPGARDNQGYINAETERDEETRVGEVGDIHEHPSKTEGGKQW